jgi:hypothetical protein
MVQQPCLKSGLPSIVPSTETNLLRSFKAIDDIIEFFPVSELRFSFIEPVDYSRFISSFLGPEIRCIRFLQAGKTVGTVTEADRKVRAHQ